MDNRVTATSKFLSFVLRHQLRAIGITLGHEGSATWKTPIAAATASGQSLDRSQVEAVVRDNDKKRFSISADGQRIRAAQGHTAGAVAIQTSGRRCDHGTARRFL